MVRFRNLAEYLRNWRLEIASKRIVEDVLPIPVYIMGAAEAGDTVPTIATAAGELDVVEASAVGISSYTRNTYRYLQDGLPLVSDATGAVTGDGIGWTPFLPQTVAADGAGNPGAAAFDPAAVAGDFIDLMVWMTADTVAGANEYVFRFRTDPLAAGGGIAPTDPAWAAVQIPIPANGTTPGNTYGHRIITTVANEQVGIAEGVNGDWPFNAQVTFYGFYRY
ncbi:unnamed protein product, partial [marine sediment metagenome]